MDGRRAPPRPAMALFVAGGLAAGLVVIGCGGGAATCGHGASCGGDGGPADGAPVDGSPAGACGKVQPCGGDVVGDWKFVAVCQSVSNEAATAANFAANAANSWCVGQTLVGQSPAVSGSFSFDAAGSYALTLVSGGTIDISLPASCLAGLTCDDTSAGLQSQIDDGAFQMPHVTSIACSGSSSCVCRATIEAPHPETGTYTISGNVLNLSPSGAAPRNQSYCIEGTTLHLVDTSTGATRQTEIATDYVAIKQQ
jgi:hypothetical protein